MLPSTDTPIIQFDCSIDPPNIRYSKTARAVTYLSRIVYRYLLDGEHDQARRYLEAMQTAGVITREGQQWTFNGQ